MGVSFIQHRTTIGFFNGSVSNHVNSENFISSYSGKSEYTIQSNYVICTAGLLLLTICDNPSIPSYIFCFLVYKLLHRLKSSIYDVHCSIDSAHAVSYGTIYVLAAHGQVDNIQAAGYISFHVIHDSNASIHT